VPHPVLEEKRGSGKWHAQDNRLLLARLAGGLYGIAHICRKCHDVLLVTGECDPSSRGNVLQDFAEIDSRCRCHSATT